MEKVAIIGANGQLGTDLCKVLTRNYEVLEVNHDVVDIVDLQRTKDYFVNCGNLFAIINTAAYHNVEECEKNAPQSYAVNAVGPANLATIVNDLCIHLVHISTDYVFDGSKNLPYVESDIPCPVNTYGVSKLAGEYQIQNTANKYCIFRTSALYGDSMCRGKNAPNFIERMIKLSETKDQLKVVDNEFVSPTSTVSLALQIEKCLTVSTRDLFHATTEGSCSWYEFVRYIFDLMNINTPLIEADAGDFPIKVPRPLYSVLENEELKKKDINIMPHWKDSLRVYLNNRVG